MNRPELRGPLHGHHDPRYEAMAFPYECLAPGTVAWFVMDSSVLPEPIVHTAAVPDTGPLPAECGSPSAFVDVDTDAVFYDEIARAAEQGSPPGGPTGPSARGSR